MENGEREWRYQPWSEQKKPWRHLEQESFVEALACGDEVGTVTGCLGAGLAKTGFSVVCLPVLHLYLQETNKKYQCVCDQPQHKDGHEVIIYDEDVIVTQEFPRTK